ncbi:unnamed protein product [Heterobilharzia americana]|nr:unnamed protein product [Heterobilharzia americana]
MIHCASDVDDCSSTLFQIRVTSMDFAIDKSPLTESEETRSNSHLPSITVVRPKQSRRYKLLPKEKLRFPKNDVSSQFWSKSNYTKHMPLIPVNCDDSEEFDGSLFQKVSNEGLHDFLKSDRQTRGWSNLSKNADEWDDWDLNLSIPSQQRTRYCCPLGCILS